MVLRAAVQSRRETGIAVFLDLGDNQDGILARVKLPMTSLVSQNDRGSLGALRVTSLRNVHMERFDGW